MNTQYRPGAVLMAVLAVVAVAACGSKQTTGGRTDAAPRTNTGASSRGNATADEVAREARGKVKCPARVATPARAASAPVDDVVGVRPGMTYEEAAHTVLCSDDLLVVSDSISRGINLQTYGQTIRQGFTARPAEPRVEKSSKQIMQEMQDAAMARGGNRIVRDMQPGQTKWYVGTMGVPGAERVINVAREEWFAADRNPVIGTVEQALKDKYGEPTRQQRSNGSVYLTWGYDPMGRRITETSRLYNRCAGVADPDGGTNYSPDCGLVIAAVVWPLRENPQLAEFMQVGVIDQAGGYQAIEQTEQALQAENAARQARQVQDASKNAATPQL
ncbi:MAG TPA: hypothetical protein P5528_06020 [Steroidobacteraceae bacterium]|nr:hypothetical protein [Steroidobacteraceae bacterium]HRX88986.1 hypothetical protein [Steroidobacteraceae bacterium]